MNTPFLSTENLSFLDICIFISIFVATLGAVAWGRRDLHKKTEGGSGENTAELLLMGRKITLPLFIASLVSSWYGGITGVTALTYEKGLYNFLTQGIFWYAVYLIFALMIIPKITLGDASTFPELVEKHLGEKAHRVTAVFNIIGLLPIAYLLSLGLFIQYFTHWPLWIATTIGLLSVFSYSLSGGLRSVVYAETVQFVSMFLAVMLVVGFAMAKYGSPLSLHEHLPPQHLTLTGGQDWSEIFVWGFIALSTLIDPTFYQRALAVKDRTIAVKGILISTVAWFIFDCCTTLGALYARAYLPNQDANESYMRFSMQILPEGIRGFFIAGVFAAIISTLDANLFSSSSILAYDLMKKNRFTKYRLQVSMVCVGITCLLAIPFFHGNIALVWKTMGAISSSCLLFPWLLMLLFPRWKNERSFLQSIYGGALFVVGSGILNFYEIPIWDSFYFGVFGSILGYLSSRISIRLL